MKRFDSPIQNVQRVQQQQLRLVELKLLRARLRVQNCEEMITQMAIRKQEEEASVARRFRDSQTMLSVESLKSMFASQDTAGEINQRLLQELRDSREHLATVEEEFRSLKSRCQGTDELLEEQKREHRQDAFRRQQVDLEDNARAVHFVNDRIAERKIKS